MDFKLVDINTFKADGNLYFRKYNFKRSKGLYTIFDNKDKSILFAGISEITFDGLSFSVLETDGFLGNILYRRDCECFISSGPDDGIFDDTFDDTFE